MEYRVRTFDLPPQLDGISPKTMEEHLGLYAGYVKNFNAISAKIVEYATESVEKNSHALSELMRRRSFEFGGMRLHELYFAQFEDGARALDKNSGLAQALARDYREYFEQYLTAIGMMRGPGWALLYWDNDAGQFLAGFSGEQHQGHFVTLPIIVALDVWEHAYIIDYGAQGKAKYIDAFFKNLNWAVCEQRFDASTQ